MAKTSGMLGFKPKAPRGPIWLVIELARFSLELVSVYSYLLRLSRNISILPLCPSKYRIRAAHLASESPGSSRRAQPIFGSSLV